jgi:hypothetical protein
MNGFNTDHPILDACQLLRDLILFCLSISIYSQSAMLGAFAALSSQVDYGERKKNQRLLY